MNIGGFNGTGTAFLLYIALGLAMPFVYMYRVFKRNKHVPVRFVIEHMLMSVSLAVLALLCIGYAWRSVERGTSGRAHELLLSASYLAIATLISWVVIPHMVVTSYKVRRKSHVLHPPNPNIHIWDELDEAAETPTA